MVITIPISEEENIKLIYALATSGQVLNLAFGLNGVAIEWDTSEPMPESLRLLGLMRGVTNKNLSGAGI